MGQRLYTVGFEWVTVSDVLNLNDMIPTDNIHIRVQ